MADRRFYSVAGPFSLAELAKLCAGELAPGTDSGRLIHDVASLTDAGPDHVTFFDNPRYAQAFAESKAGACIVHPDHVPKTPAGMGLIVTPTPYLAYAKVAQAFYPKRPPVPGVAASAWVDPAARVGAGSRIDPGAVIEGGAEIGSECWIGANSVIGPGVVLGDRVRIGPRVSLSHCLIGSDVLILAGTSIGQDGFGYAQGPGGHVKVPQLGRVIIQDRVEIGANCTIDRGSGPDTVIGAGCIIDNLVQIGHNVRLGMGCVVVSQVGISGSVRVEDGVVIGGQVGIAGHLTIGKGAKIAARSGLIGDVPAGQVVAGFPAFPIKEFFRQVAVLSSLARSSRGRNKAKKDD
ncbi:MAG: UDP-3-O-(3-hydroxymyristoyl)glucosamine N-acyltransferase [Alphaproteobacteria bacterium]